MNEQLIVALEALAAKLGTTAEYLWGILVRQAVLDGWIALVECLFYATIVGGVAWYYLRVGPRARKAWEEEARRMAKEIKQGQGYASWEMERDLEWASEEAHMFGTVVAILLAFVCFIALLVTAPTVFTAFLNPEYLAFKNITSQLP